MKGWAGHGGYAAPEVTLARAGRWAIPPVMTGGAPRGLRSPSR